MLFLAAPFVYVGTFDTSQDIANISGVNGFKFFKASISAP
jgi:hypothetical protein